jgi:hypothetical protein
VFFPQAGPIKNGLYELTLTKKGSTIQLAGLFQDQVLGGGAVLLPETTVVVYPVVATPGVEDVQLIIRNNIALHPNAGDGSK